MTIEAPNVSGYLAEAVRRAASGVSEAEKRATRAQSAFLTVVKTASELTTERMLFLAKSEVFDLGQRDNISRMEFYERLIAECKRLVGGDELKARLLASAALED